MQTGEVASRMSQFAPELTIRYAVRGEELSRGSKISDHIIIGTPGKVLDWSLKFRFFDLKQIRVFVLDEADVMIATQGHQDQSIRIHKNLSPQCQMMLFSATYDINVMNFAENIIKDPVVSLDIFQLKMLILSLKLLSDTKWLPIHCTIKILGYTAQERRRIIR